VTQGPGRQEGGPALLPSKQLAVCAPLQCRDTPPVRRRLAPLPRSSRRDNAIATTGRSPARRMPIQVGPRDGWVVSPQQRRLRDQARHSGDCETTEIARPRRRARYGTASSLWRRFQTAQAPQRRDHPRSLWPGAHPLAPLAPHAHRSRRRALRGESRDRSRTPAVGGAAPGRRGSVSGAVQAPQGGERMPHRAVAAQMGLRRKCGWTAAEIGGLRPVLARVRGAFGARAAQPIPDCYVPLDMGSGFGA
jgi:hypothetical protein